MDCWTGLGFWLDWWDWEGCCKRDLGPRNLMEGTRAVEKVLMVREMRYNDMLVIIKGFGRKLFND